MSNLEMKVNERYLKNDVISTAYEIFETNKDFFDALQILLYIVCEKFNIDTITIGETDLNKGISRGVYSWSKHGNSTTFMGERKFSKKSFENLFNSYDERGMVVLTSEIIEKYITNSKYIPGEKFRTMLYSAMYDKEKYMGAVSYIVCSEYKEWTEEEKNELGELTKIIAKYLSKYTKMNYMKDLNDDTIDTVTGLSSFYKLKEELEKKVISGKAQSYIVGYFDFDNFNYFNHKHGYSNGDVILRDFTKCVVKILGTHSHIFFSREFADKFVMFMPYLGDLNEYKEILERGFEEFSETVQARFGGTNLKVRGGIYEISTECKSAAAAIDAANYARKQLKKKKTSGICIYTEELEKEWLVESEVSNNVRKAFKNKEFKLYLQPRISVDDGSIVGAEALVRWQREDGTIIYPNSFIPIFEKNGTIVELDFYMFEEVVAYLKKNKDLGRKQIPISINASIINALHSDTAQKYVDILNKYDIERSLVEIELTETATIKDYEHVKRLYTNLQKENISTAMDDFGAGYSVYNLVMDVPINVVKIDREFVSSCTDSERARYIFCSLIEFIHRLGLRVVCEGVETEEQFQVVKNANCEEAQGYWFAKPMPVEEFEHLVYTQNSIA